MKIDSFLDFLLVYNEKVNLVSKKSTRESLLPLIDESLQLGGYITTGYVVDAGSGGGLLGIPLAIHYPEKRFVLVETIQKKVKFLKLAVDKLNLKNITISNDSIQEFMRRQKELDGTLIARGFPSLELLTEFVLKKSMRELLVITSPAKILLLKNRVANIRQNLYNIPSRNNLIIFKMENVSRET